MIKPGLESLMKRQLGDPFIGVLEAQYVILKEIGKLIGAERKKAFASNVRMFEKETLDRFNFKIKLRDSNTFAIMPIFNLSQFQDGTYEFTKGDKSTSYKQIRKFDLNLKKSNILLDMKHVKVHGLDSNVYFPLAIGIGMLDKLTQNEYVTVILHEIGHVFTLLEMYSKTNKTMSRLSDALLSNNTPAEILDNLSIGTKDSKEGIVKLYDRTMSDIDGVKLANARELDETDAEYEADYFVVNFGYGSHLTTALSKLTDINNATPTSVAFNGMIFILLTRAYILFFLATRVNVSMFLLYSIGLVIAVLIYNAMKAMGLQFKRNPNGDEHGDLITRYTSIKLGMIRLVRENDLTKDEIADIINGIEVIESNLKDIDTSGYNKILSSIVSMKLIPNFNIRDTLGNTLDILINNDLYTASAKLSVGLERLTRENLNNVLYSKTIEPFSRQLATLSKYFVDGYLDSLNEILNEYDIFIDAIDGDELEYEVTTRFKFKLCDGVSTISIVPDDDDRDVVSVTIDSSKVKWMMYNKYVKVYDIQTSECTKDKVFYTTVSEKLKIAGDGIEILSELYDRTFYENGSAYIVPTINRIIEYKEYEKLDTIFREQLEDITKCFNEEDELYMDIYSSNIGHDHDGAIVIFDPVYSHNLLIPKVDNRIMIDRSMLDNK